MGKRIAVVGVGALGGYVGGWLAHTGEDAVNASLDDVARRLGVARAHVAPEHEL